MPEEPIPKTESRVPPKKPTRPPPPPPSTKINLTEDQKMIKEYEATGELARPINQNAFR